MTKPNSLFVRAAILIFLFSCCYSFNDTRDLLYLQAYFDKQNIKKVDIFHSDPSVSEYSTNRKVDAYK
ncbi:hypothetical protein AB4F11_03745 [Francisella philomiragia]